VLGLSLIEFTPKALLFDFTPKVLLFRDGSDCTLKSKREPCSFP